MWRAISLRITVLFFNVGGYHSARLEAASETMSRHGIELTVIEILGHSSQHPWKFDRCNLPYDLMTLFDDEGAISKANMRRKIRCELEKLNPDVLVIPGWGSTEARIALNWARANRKGTVVMSESKEDDAPRNIFKEWVKARCYISKFDAGLVGGRAHRDYLESLGMPGERIFIGYDAVDNRYFHESVIAIRSNEIDARNTVPEIPSKQYFLAVTRFIPRKNLACLLDAYAMYCEQVGSANAWPLVLCGNGSEAGSIVQKVQALSLGELVHLPGFVSYERVPYWYAFAAAFIHPAIQEQWGLVLNEAAASGLPILSSDTVGAAAELVEEGLNGFLFSPLDADAIARVMVKTHHLGTDQLAAMGMASQKIVAGLGPQRFADGLFSAVSAIAH